jgi:beta-aspartyl-peptidase (threonine type)
MNTISITPFAIAIHGGAGTILRSSITPEQETAYKNALQEAILAGEHILSTGGTALNAVENNHQKN